MIAAPRHLLNQHAATGPHTPVQDPRKDRVIGFAHVLTHFDRRGRIERAIGQRPVVLDADLDPILQSPLGSARHRCRPCLRGRVRPTT